MIKFNLSHDEKLVDGNITYNDKDGGLNFVPQQNSDINILINYINIGFDSCDMTANQIWGYSPKVSWRKMNLQIPSSVNKGKLALAVHIEPGTTWRIDKLEMWVGYFDSQKKWLCFGNPSTRSDDQCVEFLHNVIAVIDHHKGLKSLWIKLKTA